MFELIATIIKLF